MAKPIQPSNPNPLIITSTRRELVTIPSKEAHQLSIVPKEKISPLSSTGKTQTRPATQIQTKPPYDAATMEEVVIRKLGSIPEFSCLTKEEIMVSLQYCIKINLNAPNNPLKSPTDSDLIVIPGIKKILFLGDHSDQFSHHLYRVGDIYSINLSDYETISLTKDEWSQLVQFLAKALEALQNFFTAQKTELKSSEQSSKKTAANPKTSTPAFSTSSKSTKTEPSLKQKQSATLETATTELQRKEKDLKANKKYRDTERKEIEREELKKEIVKEEIKKNELKKTL